MAHVNRTLLDESRQCPTCQRTLRVHEWRTEHSDGSVTAWTRTRISCDGRCNMTGVQHTVTV